MPTEPGKPVVGTGPTAPAGAAPAVSGRPAKPPRTAAEIGKANSLKGKVEERKVAAYLRVNGFLDAKRTVRTGYRAGGNCSPDEGDICGTPGLAWQVKSTHEREWWKIPNWLAAVAQQKIAARADYGILVLKRKGHADPGMWWAHLYLADIAALLGVPPELTPGSLSAQVPMRLALGDLLPLLHRAGYGDPSVSSLRVGSQVDEAAGDLA